MGQWNVGFADSQRPTVDQHGLARGKPDRRLHDRDLPTGASDLGFDEERLHRDGTLELDGQSGNEPLHAVVGQVLQGVGEQRSHRSTVQRVRIPWAAGEIGRHDDRADRGAETARLLPFRRVGHGGDSRRRPLISLGGDGRRPIA